VQIAGLHQTRADVAVNGHAIENTEKLGARAKSVVDFAADYEQDFEPIINPLNYSGLSEVELGSCRRKGESRTDGEGSKVRLSSCIRHGKRTTRHP
jgi:hypothetical protein